MPQAVTVYRWDDPGAPQMGSGNLWPGILNILKKCLVEGYGTKAAAGWTVEYEDVPANKCVFRNDPVEGSGGYVQFQRQNDRNVWYNAATFMLGIDQFTNPGYMSSLVLHTTFNNGKWILIASKTAFYLNFFRTTSTTYDNQYNSNTMFCGDFLSFIKNDPGTFITIGYQNQSLTGSNSSDALSGSNNSILHSRALNTVFLGSSNNATELRLLMPLMGDGATTTTPHLLTNPLGSSGGRNEAIPQGPQLSDKLYLTSSDNIQSLNPNNPNVRGFLPGFICLPLSWWYGAVWPVILDDYLLLSENAGNTSTQGGGRRLINLVGWEVPNRD